MEAGIGALVAAVTALFGSGIAVYRVIFVEPKAARQTQVSELWDENRDLRADLNSARDSLADAWDKIDVLRDRVGMLEGTVATCRKESQRLADLVVTLGGTP